MVENAAELVGNPLALVHRDVHRFGPARTAHAPLHRALLRSIFRGGAAVALPDFAMLPPTAHNRDLHSLGRLFDLRDAGVAWSVCCGGGDAELHRLLTPRANM